MLDVSPVSRVAFATIVQIDTHNRAKICYKTPQMILRIIVKT